MFLKDLFEKVKFEKSQQMTLTFHKTFDFGYCVSTIDYRVGDTGMDPSKKSQSYQANSHRGNPRNSVDVANT